jgi:hypothetical protein
VADWTTIPDTTFEPGAPAKGRDMRFLRDNPIAIAEGAPGAPRIAGQQGPAVQAAGLFTGNAERDWVLARTAAAEAGAVGTYALLATASSNQGGASTGATFSGSALRNANILERSDGTLELQLNDARLGTWRLMSQFGELTVRRVAVFLRIS